MKLPHRLAKRARRYAGARLEFAVRVWSLEFSPVLMPWSRLQQDQSIISQLRRVAIAIIWKTTRARPDRIILWVFGTIWPLIAALRALALVMKQGRFVRASAGLSSFRQWRECVVIANTLNYSPHTYYGYRFFDHSIQPDDFIQVLEFTVLQLRDIGISSVRVLNDKMRFFDECSLLQLPTPQVVTLMMPREPERWMTERAGELPRRHLFLKWVDSELGVGAERWSFHRGTGEWMRRDARLGHDDMLAYCRSRACKRGLLVQHAISNHPEIERLSGATLSTLRVVTYRDPGAPAVLVRAVLRIARPGADVDNVSAGGLASALDPQTGTLGVARGKLPSDGEHTHHPDTGAPILGLRLTTSSAAIDLALSAHAGLDSVPWSVGWDVAMTPDGPMLVEGNPLWSVKGAQSPHGAPLPAQFTSRLLARVQAAGQQTWERTP